MSKRREPVKDDSEYSDTEMDFNPKIKLLEASSRSYFARLQKIYNVSQNLSSIENREQFLTLTTTIKTMRSEFRKVIEDLNLAHMRINTSYEPNFQTWEAFEDLYSHIQRALEQFNLEKTFSAPTKRSLNLPAINLPKFDGEIKSWTTFYECYNNTIHNNTALLDSEKVYYLCGQLSGKALSSISGIAPTGDNYNLIYSILVDKYQDVRSLGTAYLDQILNLKHANNSSIESLNNFIDKFASSVAAFEKLEILDKKDFIYLFLALKKIDNETARSYENSVRSEKIPTYDSFLKFVREQAKIAGRVATTPAPLNNFNRSFLPKMPTTFKTFSQPAQTLRQPSRDMNTFITSNNSKCSLCHNIEHDQFYRCPSFMKMTPKERYNVVKQKGSCVNCLSLNHRTSSCNSVNVCAVCQSNTHHTLLHFPENISTDVNSENQISPTSRPHKNFVIGNFIENTEHGNTIEMEHAGASCVHFTSTKNECLSDASINICKNISSHSVAKDPTVLHANMLTTALLGTALVKVYDANGQAHLVRCLIDIGSQKHFITTACCNRLSLPYKKFTDIVSVSGFGGSAKTVKGLVDVTIHSRFDETISFNICSVVADNITSSLPTSNIDKSTLDYLFSVPLADDTFAEPGEIEMLLGVQLFPSILMSGRVSGPPNSPTAIQTSLGFIVMGEAAVALPMYRSRTHSLCAITGIPLDSLIHKFWEIEDVTSTQSNLLSSDDKRCEEIYKSTTTRDLSGRYTVTLPFKTDPRVLGNSFNNAKKRFLSLERKLTASPSYRTAYDAVMKDYLEKDFMASTPVGNNESTGYIIPHHGVIREDRITTKVRVVLDASANTDKGVSLNDILFTGPNLQADLFLTLLNFRLYPIAFCADIKQMYLQINVHPDFHKYQRLLYRFNPSDPLQVFEFKRVCFGLSVSPYLALRTVKQLTDDERQNFPRAADIIDRGDYYMDDIVGSVDSLSSALEVTSQLYRMFASGGFELLKWSSNSTDLISSFPPDHLHPQATKFDSESPQKVLGMKWEAHTDTLSFEVCHNDVTCTKRNMLSVIARLWDVLGLVAPVILYAKLLIKELWILKINWDDIPPTSYN